MGTGYFTVRVNIPGQPGEEITTIAHGPASALSAITRLFRFRREASKPGIRFNVRSGWWLAGQRVDPVPAKPAAEPAGLIASAWQRGEEAFRRGELPPADPDEAEAWYYAENAAARRMA